MDSEDACFSLNLEECKLVFRKFKKDEAKLTDDELRILQRIEKMLYTKLSIKEIVELTG